ncbi:MAG: exosortase C-terminal domain/associated protein EpsI [Gemmatimonadota bacterium]
MRKLRPWIPALILGIGAITVRSVGRQRPMPLRAPLSTIPAVIEGFSSVDAPISKETQRVAGMSNYLSRLYGDQAFSVYVGYYESQTQGRTIHSPKNCLPGAGWEAISSGEQQVATPLGSVAVNRYIITKGNSRALVYYWYQGRGRVSANEYRVKWELIRDASVLRRTDEALVRVVVPIKTSESDAEALATKVAANLVGSVDQVLPGVT